MSGRIQGTVKWFNSGKGYGFISREAATMCSCISPPSRATATASCTKGSASSSPSPRAQGPAGRVGYRPLVGRFDEAHSPRASPGASRFILESADPSPPCWEWPQLRTRSCVAVSHQAAHSDLTSVSPHGHGVPPELAPAPERKCMQGALFRPASVSRGGSMERQSRSRWSDPPPPSADHPVAGWSVCRRWTGRASPGG